LQAGGACSLTFMKQHKFYFSLALLAVFFAKAITHADVVTDWNDAALNAIRAAKTPPPVASRALAILHAYYLQPKGHRSRK
jgi:hypothetical protein